jgi:signal transduction histidine kinase
MEAEMSIKPSILIVDDEPSVCNSIKELLRDFDYEIHTTNGGGEAIESLIKFNFDLILLDLLMPEVDGFQVMDYIAHNSPDTLVIIMTGHATVDSAIEALKKGAYHYIRKPFEMGELINSINNALDKRKLEASKKMAEEALKESSEKIKLFAYSISHDLKSPAIGIHGLTKKLYENYSEVFDEKGKKYCDQILKASVQIVELVNNINLYISAREANLKIEDTPLKEIIQTVREEFSTQCDFRRIEWAEPKQIPVIKADRYSILRVLRNFVDNALKYGGGDLSEIKFDYRESGDFHTISVSDNGIGINSEDCKRIFEPFYRNPDSGRIQGTGLGLAIIKEIARQHGGEVWAEPNPLRGVTFHMSIPKLI